MLRLKTSSTVRRPHRRLGPAFSLVAFLAAGSGVLHTVMTWTQSPPPPARPSGATIDPTRVVVPLAEAIAKAPGPRGPVQSVTVRQVDGAPWYRIDFQGDERPEYVNATTGEHGPEVDEAQAAQIASDFLGGAKATKSAFLDRFDSEYIAIFRVLPVYRFDANDELGTRLYVSTATGSVTRHTDDHRQFEASVFSNFHKWTFVPNKFARDLVMVVAMGGATSAAALGVGLFFLTGPVRPRRALVPNGGAPRS